MDWQRDLKTWPNAEHSRRIHHGPHVWHVQEKGQGLLLLLLHGAGASTHSWRDLFTSLSRDHHVVALDLPGQGFSVPARRARFGLVEMADDIAALQLAEGWSPHAIIGHSAGVALALRLASILPGSTGVIGINPALANFRGVAGVLFPILAKVLALNPLTPFLFSIGSGPAQARRLIEGTGSRLSPEGIALYARLLADRAHVDGALQMMARWDLTRLLEDLPVLASECLFIVGERDEAVPPQSVMDAAARMRNVRVERLPELGHLAHEEAPGTVETIMREYLGRRSNPVRDPSD